jgi:polar amino acid transport system substrate-binding protein
MRRSLIAAVITGSLLLAACGGDDSDTTDSDTTDETSAPAETAAPSETEAPAATGTGNECTAGKTLEEGVLTIATGNPAFGPWVVDDTPESGEGFEAAVAYAVAEEMGFAAENVAWVRTGFDEAIQPGPKTFDFNLQQYTITEERKATVSFSAPYYSTNQAVVALAGSPAEGAATIADLKGVKFGAQAGTTSLDFITDVIAPDAEPFVYDDNVGAKAALEAGQIDAIVVDLPTALYISAVEIEGSSVTGQFPLVEGVPVDDFGLLFDLDNPLVECVDAALAALKDSGELAAIETEWMSTDAGIPVIAVE